MKLTVSHEFIGCSDYWGGNGRRWDSDAGCVFAFYGRDTTLRDCVDQWVEDFMMGGDFVDGCDAWDEVTRSDIRNAILDSFTDHGRADYESGALCDGAAEWVDVWNPADESLAVDDAVCIKVNGKYVVGTVHGKWNLNYMISVDNVIHFRPLEDILVLDEDDEYYDSPIWVLLIELEEEDG